MSQVLAGGLNAGWVTALDINFANQPTQTLSPDGIYTIGGFSFTKINSANDNAVMVLTNGLGIVITPKQATDYYAAVRTDPALTVSLSSVIPGFSPSVRTRLWLYVAAGNLVAQYDHVVMAAEVPGVGRPEANYEIQTVFATFKRLAAITNVSGANVGHVNLTAASGAKNVLVIECSRGIGEAHALYLAGTWSAGWPGDSALSTYAMRGMPAGSDDIVMDAWGASTSWDVFFGAGRAGSGTALAVTIGALKVEYMP